MRNWKTQIKFEIFFDSHFNYRLLLVWQHILSWFLFCWFLGWFLFEEFWSILKPTWSITFTFRIQSLYRISTWSNLTVTIFLKIYQTLSFKRIPVLGSCLIFVFLVILLLLLNFCNCFSRLIIFKWSWLLKQIIHVAFPVVARWIWSPNHLFWIVSCWLRLSLLGLRIRSLRNSWWGKNGWSIYLFCLPFLVRWKLDHGFASGRDLLLRRIW